MADSSRRRIGRRIQFGKKVTAELFDIYYEALSKEEPEFGEIPPKYQVLIHRTLEDDLLIQRGRANDLKPLSAMQRMSEIAYQKAQNRVAGERQKREQRDRED